MTMFRSDVADSDPVETQEWRESLEAVIDRSGVELRALVFDHVEQAIFRLWLALSPNHQEVGSVLSLPAS